jgi:hypothetical protein
MNYSLVWLHTEHKSYGGIVKDVRALVPMTGLWFWL